MKVVVVGGAGFIGSHYSELMLERGFEVVIYDALTYAAVHRSHPLFTSVPEDVDFNRTYRLNDNCELKVVDITDADGVLLNLEGDAPDVVVNFAAESHVDNSIEDATPFIMTNVVGVLNLLEAVKFTGVSRFVQVSTDEVYGTIANGSFTEGSTLKPRSPYAASKASADHLVLSYVVTHGLNASITRSSNNFGPYQHVEKFLPHMISKMCTGRKVPVYGDGTNVRDWLYVTDNCNGIANVMQFGAAGEVYNIAGNHELTNIELVQMVAKKLGLDPESSYEFVTDRKGHDFRYSVDCSKLRMEIGWDRTVGFDEGLNRTVEHYMRIYI